MKNQPTKLDRLTTKLHIALQNQTKNVIEIGKLLIESREYLEHGEWLPWLAENFDLSARTAQRYVAVGEYVARKGKNDTVSHFANLSATVLYQLAKGDFDERVEATILTEARKRRIDENAMWLINEALMPRDDEDADDREDGGEPPVAPPSRTGPPRDDIGPASAGEAERLRVRVEELQADKRRLEMKVAGLESEVEEAKTAARLPAKSGRCSICHEKKQAVLRPVFICDGCVHTFEVREAVPSDAALRRESA